MLRGAGACRQDAAGVRPPLPSPTGFPERQRLGAPWEGEVGFCVVGANGKGKAPQPEERKSAYSVPIATGTSNGSASQYGGGVQLSPRWLYIYIYIYVHMGEAAPSS